VRNSEARSGAGLLLSMSDLRLLKAIP